MNRLIFFISLLLIFLIPACTSSPEQYSALESRVVEVTSFQSILVQVDYGEVVVLGSEDAYVEIGGQVLFADDLEYQVVSTEKQISIRVLSKNAGFSGIPLQVVVRIPQQLQVVVETDTASVFVQDYNGDLEVASTAGNLTVENTIGKITLRSNRGNITVLESTGNISVVGNYGLLNLKNVHGKTGVSTIMGNIGFDGLVHAEDAVHLETDHGSVSVNLSQDSALGIQVRSTSGDVTCMLPGISTTTRTCDGEIQSDGGTLSIRTVSGAVIVKLMP